MKKLYVGVDLHKRSCRVTVLDADGHLLESRRMGTEKQELEAYFGQVRKPAADGAQVRAARAAKL